MKNPFFRKWLKAAIDAPGRIVRKIFQSSKVNACRRLGITHAQNGLALDAPPFELRARTGECDVVAGPRIGITRAIELPWRYGLKGSRFFSKPFKA